MSLSKEQLMKINGVKLKMVEEDSDVLSRRPKLIARLQWSLRNSGYFHLAIATASFFMILLPSFSKTFFNFIHHIDILFIIYSGFVLNKSLYLLNFIFVGIIGILGQKVELSDTFEKGTVKINYRMMMEMDLYPRTKSEERWFYIGLFVYLSFPALWPMAFSIIAMLFKS